MGYRFLSPRTSDVHDIYQWKDRTLKEELKSFEHRTVVAVFDQFLSRNNARVLEGGCGLGAWCMWFKQRGHDVVGIEYNENIARRATQYQQDIPVELGDVTNLKYPNNSFNAYISLGVIEHFEHGPEKVINEAYRVLRPGGMMFVSTPYLNVMRRLVAHPLRNIYFLLRRLSDKPSSFWEYRFSKKELCNYLEKAGFKIISVYIDDYEKYEKNRHIGLWTDWFFLRKQSGAVWELNKLGKMALRFVRLLPAWWYSSGLLVVTKAVKEP